MTNGGNVVLAIHGIILPHAAVAQLDRVLGYAPRGRGFESCQPRHLTGVSGRWVFWFLLHSAFFTTFFPPSSPKAPPSGGVFFEPLLTGYDFEVIFTMDCDIFNG